MRISDTDLAEVKILEPVRHVDARGFFSEVYREDTLHSQMRNVRFVQENHSFSVARGVLRGLHFQIPPHSQAKLLRVTAGRIFDVAVDIRWGSPTYGRHVALIVSAAEWNQIFIPEGFAHGFCTLEPNTEVIYKVSHYYSAEHDRGLLWNDPTLDIPWPITEAEATLSEKDRKHPRLTELPRFFLYQAPGLQVTQP